MVLDAKAKVEKNLLHLELNDFIFEVDNKSITIDRIGGHFGMAREMATFLDTDVTKLYKHIDKLKMEAHEGDNLNIKVSSRNFARYTAISINNVK